MIYISSLLRRASAELIATYLLVVAGCGAIVANSLTGSGRRSAHQEELSKPGQ